MCHILTAQKASKYRYIKILQSYNLKTEDTDNLSDIQLTGE